MKEIFEKFEGPMSLPICLLHSKKEITCLKSGKFDKAFSKCNKAAKFLCIIMFHFG